MRQIKSNPVKSLDNLRERVERLLRGASKKGATRQLSLSITDDNYEFNSPSKNIAEFLDFITDAVPDGDVYLFGGVLRDLALYGRRGFDSDIDLVVVGKWSQFVTYLEARGAYKNKFGGYRLQVGKWPVDIWNAKETWAIKQGLVEFKGIGSLIETTVMNWDAILMNWRTRTFICRDNYIDEINQRALDIVLELNPNPLGMAVRVFRHLCMKDVRKLTHKATRYLAVCAKSYEYEELVEAEICSYKENMIDRAVYKFFECLDVSGGSDLNHQFSIAENLIMRDFEVEGIYQPNKIACK